MTLHIISQSPHSDSSFEECLSLVKADDAIIFISDGCYCATLTQALTKNPFYVITEDLQARGLDEKLTEGVTGIDYDDFVDLCARYHPIQHWF